MTGSRSPYSPFLLLCFGFVICGTVTVLAGPLLPVLAARWGLRDVQSGEFFAAQFAFSTAGAILSPLRLRRNLSGGYALIAAGLFLLYLAAGTARPVSGHVLGLAAFSLIGLGIGLSVTATNLHVGATSANRARRLSLVNLSWGCGAVACPGLIAAAERTSHLRFLLVLIGLAAAGIFAALAPILRLPDRATTESLPPVAFDTRLLAFFALFLFLYVGMENAVGGWITTYTHRFNGMSLEDASIMVSLYWLALLAGRGIGSLALSFLPERAVLLSGFLLALSALSLLLVPRSASSAMIAVAATGMGFGPVFPIAVSRMLARAKDPRSTGWVFAVSASGGATLPWLTGFLSTHSGSLRIGFIVPGASLCAIFVLAMLENKILGEPAPSPVAT